MVDLLLVDVLNPFSSFDVLFLLVDVVGKPIVDIHRFLDVKSAF